MKQVLLQNIDLKVEVADTFWRRLKGLLGTKFLADGRALLIKPCNSVHMVGMCYAIDVIYLDKNDSIIKIVENLKPWVGVSFCFRAKSVLEIASGTAKQYNLQIGQKLFA